MPAATADIDPVDAASLRFSALGACALLAEAPAPMDLPRQRRIWALAREAQEWDGVQEAAPGMNNLLLVFDPFTVEAAALRERIATRWPQCEWTGAAGRMHEVPVVYGGENGMDLALVASHARLSVREVVKLHSQALYTVYFLGAYPGFGYLGGLDPRLATPRRNEPRLKVPANAVAIGGAQAGVLPSPVPSGWNVIGQARAEFFDLRRDPPALLAPGDEVRFLVERIEA